MLNKLVNEAEKNHIEIFQVESDTNSGLKYCLFMEGELSLQEIENRLYLDDVDWKLIDDWIKDVVAQSSGVTTEIFNETPKKDLEEFCRVYTEIVNQRPTGSMEQDIFISPESRRIEEKYFFDKNYTWKTIITREQDGKISGITEFQISPMEPHKIVQRLTGVLKSYRGRKLGKRLKAEMLKLVKEYYPHSKYITTGNAKNNIPMISINKQLGFIQYRTLTIIKWDLQTLKTNLKLKSSHLN